MPVREIFGRIRETNAHDLRVDPARSESSETPPVESSWERLPSLRGVVSSEPSGGLLRVVVLSGLTPMLLARVWVYLQLQHFVKLLARHSSQRGVFPMSHRGFRRNSVEFAYAATGTQRQSHSDKENTKIIPNTFKEAMRLPEPKLRKAASDEEMKSLQDLNVYTLVTRSEVPP